MKDSSLAVLALTNRLLDVGASPLKASEFWRLVETTDELGALLGASADQLTETATETGLDAGRLTTLLDAGVALAVRVDELWGKGILPITWADEAYPHRLRERLGSAAPPVLYCAGDAALLAEDGIGMVGSRDVAQEGAEVTQKAAHQVAGHGLVLVSGGAKGVDQLSMAAAYEAGGNVVGVLADSLERAVGRRENRHALLDGRSCLCTPYQPNARFTAGAAMGRNKLIYGLSRATLVVASAKGEGGTWAGATEALRKRYGAVAVWMGSGAGPGNKALVELGAVAVDEPEAVLRLDAVDTRSSDAERQMTLTFGAEKRSADLAASVEEGESRPGALEAVDPVPVPLPPGVLEPKPTGVCWCGCGNPVGEGAFFLPRHAPGAAQRAVIKHFGSVEAFLVGLGEAPPPGIAG